MSSIIAQIFSKNPAKLHHSAKSDKPEASFLVDNRSFCVVE